MSKQKYSTSSTTVSTDGTKSTRTGRSHYSSVKLHAKRARKYHEALDRQLKYDDLSIADKLAGLPVGACQRQRTRLEKQLAAEKTAKTVKK